MGSRKTAVKSTVKIKAYDILARAVEEGAEYGWRRAHKYFDREIGTSGEGTAPTAVGVREKMVESILNQLCEVIEFE